jgi:hypothetical protein
MSLATFLVSLFDDGRVRAAAPARLSEEELRAAEAELARFEADFRQEFPGPAPAYDPRAALWGATMFYRAAQFVVYRDVDAPTMAEALSAPGPAANSPAAHYSVDLTFRFLPDLFRLAQSAAGNDPLLAHLVRWRNEWPLSSVGMADVAPRNLDPVANHAELLTLYVDRVLARGDRGRLADVRVRAAARRAVGAFPQLAGKLADEFQPEESFA